MEEGKKWIALFKKRWDTLKITGGKKLYLTLSFAFQSRKYT